MLWYRCCMRLLAPNGSSIGADQSAIVVGFLLGLMAIIFQGRAQKTLAAMEISWGRSALQNLEAITQMELLGQHKSMMTRMSIVFLLDLPLGLSVAYKRFVGGTTITSGSSSQNIMFGPTPPPGTQNIGWGLSLFSSTMQPWWSDPRYPAVYGYSLATISRDRTALLDGPLPSEIANLQAGMRPGEAHIIIARVSAIEAQLIASWAASSLASVDIATLKKYMGFSEECSNDDGSNPSCSNKQLLTNYLGCNGVTHSSGMLYNTAMTVGVATGTCNSDHAGNNSFTLLSRADNPTNASDQIDNFQHAAQAFSVSVQRYSGMWNITRDSALLLDAHPLIPVPLTDHSYSFDSAQRRAISDTYCGFEDVYLPIISEFDWKFPLQRTASAVNHDFSLDPVFNITTDATFAATMIWSRLATKVGPTNPEYRMDSEDKGVLKYTVPAVVKVHTQTLKRH